MTRGKTCRYRCHNVDRLRSCRGGGCCCCCSTGGGGTMDDNNTAVARIIRRCRCCGSSHVGVALLQSSSWRPWDGHTILRVRAPICGVWLHTINTPPPRRRRRIVASYDKYSSSSSSSSNRGFIRQILLLLVVVVVESLLLWTTQPLNLPEKGCHNSRYGAHFGKD